MFQAWELLALTAEAYFLVCGAPYVRALYFFLDLGINASVAPFQHEKSASAAIYAAFADKVASKLHLSILN